MTTMLLGGALFFAGVVLSVFAFLERQRSKEINAVTDKIKHVQFLQKVRNQLDKLND